MKKLQRGLADDSPPYPMTTIYIYGEPSTVLNPRPDPLVGYCRWEQRRVNMKDVSYTLWYYDRTRLNLFVAWKESLWCNG